MKTQTISVASDGTRFDSPSACIEYESLCSKVAKALAPLGPDRDIPSMSYWQHDPEAVSRAWSAFYEICKAELGEAIPWITQKMAIQVHPASYLGRVLSEMGRKCMSDAGYRFHCIDTEGREFDQPFWAYHRKDKSLAGHTKLNA